MQSGVYVNSFAAIEQFRASFCAFRDESTQALLTVMAEADRFLLWLKHDQLGLWKQEIRRREEQLAEAKADLHRCLAATIDPHRTPSCYQEKKLVAKAKWQFEEAESKLAAVRRWIPLIEQAIFEFRSRTEPLATTLASDFPRALGELDQALGRLAAYLAVATPNTGGLIDGDGST